MRYVVPIVLWFLLFMPLKLLLGEGFALTVTGITCYAVWYYWPKAQPAGEQTPDSPASPRPPQ